MARDLLQDAKAVTAEERSRQRAANDERREREFERLRTRVREILARGEFDPDEYGDGKRGADLDGLPTYELGGFRFVWQEYRTGGPVVLKVCPVCGEVCRRALGYGREWLARSLAEVARDFDHAGHGCPGLFDVKMTTAELEAFRSIASHDTDALSMLVSPAEAEVLKGWRVR